MKIKLHTIALVLPLMAAGPAFGSVITGATSSTNVNYTIEDGVATIYGTVDSNMEKTMVGYNAADLEGVDEVRNLLFVSE